MSNSRIANLTCISFLLGIFCNSLLPLSLCGKVEILAILLFFRSKKYRFIPFLVGGLCFGIFWTQHWQKTHELSFPEPLVTLQGTITEPPDVRSDKILLTIQPEGKRGKLLVFAPRYPNWKYGDFVTVSGIAEKPEPFNGFNYPLYLERFGVSATIPRPKSLKLLEHNRGSPFLATLYTIRSHLEKQIQNIMPEPEASFLEGILLGSKQTIPQKIQDALRGTGTSHIIAISGANITILLMILISILPAHTAKRKFIITLLIGGFITLLTGASASVMRGALVAIFGCYLRLKSRRAWTAPLILVSMTLLLLGNPLLLLADPGFQLSFAAFSGLLYLGGPLKKFLENGKYTSIFPGIIQASLAETMAATIGTAPLSLYLFHQLSLLGLVVNPLILWLLPAITLLGLLVLLVGWIPFSMYFLGMPLWLLLHLVLSIIQTFARITFTTIQIGIPHA